MKSALSVSDVLGVKYLVRWDWNPAGDRIAFTWDDGGLTDLWLVEPAKGEPRRLTEAKAGVSGFVWTPQGDLLAVVDGGLVQFGKDLSCGSHTVLLKGGQIGSLSLSGDGAYLAFMKSGAVWFREQRSGALYEFAVPGRAQPVGRGGGAVEWSPSGRRFVFAFRDEESYSQIGVGHLSSSGAVLDWRSYWKRGAMGVSWLDDATLMFAVPDSSGHSSELVAMKVPPLGTPPTLDSLLVVAGTGRGSVGFAPGALSPDRSRVLLSLENDGWSHHYLFTPATKELKQMTFGECEDYAHAGDSAVWVPDGSGFYFASNRNGSAERQIFRCDIDSGECQEIVSLAGTNSLTKVSSRGDLAFQHCDEFRNMDLWVCDRDGGGVRQVTHSMPPVWTVEAQSASEEVVYKSAGDKAIHAFLMKPKDVAPDVRLPAIVWVHGGPIRQMRKGWHPMRSYALFHAFNQYLVGQGYAVLYLNFRGGIGYGRDFRQALYHTMGVDDVADVVGAGNYLKALPYVDPERVAVYGLSYGGYMTLHCLTQFPDVYRCGVNIAGIWDYVQWTKWADKRYGRGGGMFKANLGGEPEESPELYRQGSPKTFVAGMKAPVLNVHGTADMNVDYQQMDSIIRDLVDHGKDFEVAYYPGEVHTFAKRKTWMDAMPKMAAFFDKHLK